MNTHANQTRSTHNVRSRFSLLAIAAGLAIVVSATGQSDAPVSSRPGKAERERLLREYFLKNHSDETGQSRPDLWRKGVEDYIKLDTAISPGLGTGAHTKGPFTALPGIQWTQIGPAPMYVDLERNYQGQGPNAGAVVDIAIDPRGTNDQTIYIASNDGGIWRTLDGGQNWKPMSDYMPTLSIGAVALDSGNADIVYAGSGNYFHNGFFKGLGVFKSTDKGFSWNIPASSALMNGQSIQRIVSPAANVILVGTFTLGADQATITGGSLFKSIDGGEHYGNDVPNFTNGMPVFTLPISDIDVDPADATRIYACVPGTGIYLSRDGGSTFPEQIFVNNQPNRKRGYISLAQSVQPNSMTLYATVAQNTAPLFRGLFKSVDRGTNWFQVSAATNIIADLKTNLQVGYDQTIGVDPQNPNLVYMAFQQLYASTNGGTNFTVPAISANGVHWDHHAILFSPTSHISAPAPTRMWIGTDGGIDCTLDAGTTWITNLDRTLATSLFRGIDIGRGSTANRAYTYGGTQDRGTMQRRPDYTLSPTEWHSSVNADGGAGAVAARNPLYALTTQNGSLRITTNGGTFWNYYSFSSRSYVNSNGVFFGTNGAFQGTQIGTAPPSVWRVAVDPNSVSNVFVLTSQNIGFSPGPDLYRNMGAFPATNFPAAPLHTFLANGNCIANTKSNSNILWVGLDNGDILRTASALGADNWTDVTRAPLPGRAVGGIAIDPTNTSIAVAVYEGFSGTAPPGLSGHVFMTTNNGANWRDISGTNGGTQNLPDLPLHSVVIDPSTTPHSIIVASDAGVMVTADLGKTWQKLGYGLPVVDCTSLCLDSDTNGAVLRVGTYGRSVFELKAATGPILAVLGDLNYPTVGMGASVDRTLILSNAGSANLTVTNITSNDPAFISQMDTNILPLVFQPGTYASFEVRFAPTRLGTNTGTIRIGSDDQFQPSYPVPASGVGVLGSSLPGFVIDPTRQQGADRPSDFDWRALLTLTNGQTLGGLVADDFRSDGARVRAVRWWGSYLNGGDAGDEDGFVLSFLGDVTSGVDTNYSHPGTVLGTYVAPITSVTRFRTPFLGLDGQFIYQYELNLTNAALVPGSGTNATSGGFLGVSNSVYWLSAAAEIGAQIILQTNGNVISFTNRPSGKYVPLNHFWGWHTTPCTNLDSSTTGNLRLNQATNWAYSAWASNGPIYLEVDQAFQLLTNLVAAPTNLVPAVKLAQRPNLTTNGIDVMSVNVSLGGQTNCVADDFRCQISGLITDIRIWGSWLNDDIDTNAQFQLEIRSDIPAGGTNLFSRPGDPLWQSTFYPNGSPGYDYGPVSTGVQESFMDPKTTNLLGNDTIVFQYNFHVATNQAFTQTNGTIYWLSVRALSPKMFGWKTAITNDHFQDAAVCSVADLFSQQWQPAQYPSNHLYAGTPMDMSFAFTTAATPGAAAALGNPPKVISALTRGAPTSVFVTYDKPVVPGSGTYTFSALVAEQSRASSSNDTLITLTLNNTFPSNTLLNLTIQGVTDKETPSHLLDPNPTIVPIYQGPGQLCASFATNNLPGQTLYGDATIPGDGILHLTDAATNKTGSLVIDRGYGGAVVSCFTARYSLLIGGGAAPGLGHSFCFANDLPAQAFGVEGGGSGLIVSFDTIGTGNGPAVDIIWDGGLVGQAPFPGSQGPGGTNFADVRIELTDNGQVTVQYQGVALFAGLQLPNYAPIQGPQFGLGASTGAGSDQHWVKNLCLNDYTQGAPIVTAQPVSRTVQTGATATFTAQVTGSPCLSYQWFADGNAIDGANSAVYTTPAAQPWDDGTEFVLQIVNSAGTTNTQPAILSVVASTNPPVLVSASSLNGALIDLCFNEPLDANSAANPANYSINGAPAGQGINSATVRFGLDSVVLVLNSQLVGSFSVTAAGIADQYGNLGGGTVAGNTAGLFNLDVGATGSPGEGFTCVDGSFQVTVAGTGIGGTADSEHFVGTMLSGDFDIRVQVSGLEAGDDPDVPTTSPQGGLQARESLGASAVSLQVYYTSPDLDNSIETTLRQTAGGPTTNWPGGGCSGAGCNLDDTPWLRLVRTGNHFDAYNSADGTNWNAVGSIDQLVATNLFVGTATASPDPADATTANYSNLSIASAGPAPLTIIRDVLGNVVVTWRQTGSRLQQTHDLVNPPSNIVWTIISSNAPIYIPKPLLYPSNTFYRLLLP
jgi:hypothetical protein